MSAEEAAARPFEIGDIVRCKEEDADNGGHKYIVGTLAKVAGVGKTRYGSQTFFIQNSYCNTSGLSSFRWSLHSLPRNPLSTPSDPVTHPAHYTAHPSGIECITITEHMGFCLGNAMKYIWRADLKADSIQDLRKAVWYLEREIAKREKPKP